MLIITFYFMILIFNSELLLSNKLQEKFFIIHVIALFFTVKLYQNNLYIMYYVWLLIQAGS